MSAFRAFFKKELCEAARTHKLTVMGLLFLLFGIMNPLTAKLLPDILSSVMPAGMSITLPAPSATDSWAQFLKNIPQMGLIVLVILFGGIMANELSRGTLTHLLTKGLSRKTVILAKFAVAALIWTAAYALCFGVTYVYTVYFWPMDRVQSLLVSSVGLWVFGLLLLSTLPLGGVLFRSGYGCLLLTGALVVVLYLLNILPVLQPYNPVMLSSDNMTLLTSQRSADDFTAPMLVSVGLITAFLYSAIAIFNRKSL